MKRNLVICMVLIMAQWLSAQNAYTSAKDSDPKAKLILNKLQKQYDSYTSMEVAFDLLLDLPGQPKENQSGNLVQSGSKYFVKMKDQEIYADGKTVWIYLKKNKEVQITDMDDNESSDMMSPKQMMRLYESGDFVYAITSEKSVAGKKMVEIEFKPISKKSEYTKMKLVVNQTDNAMSSLNVLSRDGSNFTLKVKDIKSNKKYEPNQFIFNPKAISGVHIEDLRID